MAAAQRVVVSGASGLLGQALVPALRARGIEVARLVRRAPRADDEVRWDVAAGTIDVEGLHGVTGAIHLAGDNVASGRWTEAKKASIRDSRVQGTTLLAGALAGLSPKPRVMVSASAIGYYGSRGDETLDERASAGEGFLASVCVDWEAATEAARAAAIRVVNARIGVVLAADGGALAKMKPPFLLGVGGRIGDGTQYMSWITLDDVVSALIFALERDELSGPVNLVSPSPVTNAELTDTLGHVLKRPTLFSVPKFALRLGMGSQMADEMLISSTRVVPAMLQEHGFRWQHADLTSALRSVL